MEMKELIEGLLESKEKVSNIWKELSEDMKLLSDIEVKLFLFSKSIDRLNIDNSKLEKARKAFVKAGDDVVDALSDIKKKI